jgi:hypothetical protein
MAVSKSGLILCVESCLFGMITLPLAIVKSILNCATLPKEFVLDVSTPPISAVDFIGSPMLCCALGH